MAKYRLVNALVVLGCAFCLFFSGCGFRLNRNRVQLLNSATSVSIFEIVNSSYTPGLDIDLRSRLMGELQQRSVALSTPQRADLVLSCEIVSFQIGKSKYALDTETDIQTYQFRFDIAGKLTVLDNRYRENRSPAGYLRESGGKGGQSAGGRRYRAISEELVTGSYALKTANEDADRNERSEGRKRAVAALKDRILQRISLTF